MTDRPNQLDNWLAFIAALVMLVLLFSTVGKRANPVHVLTGTANPAAESAAN